MLVIKINTAFSDEASLKAKSAVKAYLSKKSLEDISSVKDRLGEREEKYGVTCFSTHVIDRAQMYAKGKSDFEEAVDFSGGSSDFIINMWSNIMHKAQQESFKSALAVARQQIEAEKEKRLHRRFMRRIFK